MTHYDVVVIGAGAAGMMCAIEAGKRGRSVLVLEHNKVPGDKIRISGGGRCNFTNMRTTANNYLSQNPKFALSALKRYTQNDFVALVERHGISFHEKVLGQLFCDGSAQQIIDMLLYEMDEAGVKLRCGVSVEAVDPADAGYLVRVDGNAIECTSLVVACGGKSIPKMGASNFGYRLAEQFSVPQIETRPALVPLTFGADLLTMTKELSGVSVDAVVSCGKTSFDEAMLFTHRGLSGPAILQISSYWREGDAINIDMTPDVEVLGFLKERRAAPGKREVGAVLAEIIPKRLAQMIADDFPGKVGEMNDKMLTAISDRVKGWSVTPVGSEGYRTAEVTLGGVDTAALNAKTMETKAVAGLYFIGEVVDMTGWLGGYNFQWAWSSGWAAGQAV